MAKYDVAAYVWPAYTGDEPRTRIFWPDGIGEWQTVKSAAAKFEGHKWPREPLWGYCNEADPLTMETQIQAAADHGVNVFIYDWYWYDNRPFLEQCLDNGFLKAKNNNKMKFYLMWANHDALSLWDKRTAEFADLIWDGKVNREQFETVVQRIITKYFKEPNYYKINDKPVFMIYDINNLITGLGGIEQTAEALQYFKKETVRAGYPGLHLQMTLWSENAVNLSGVDSKRIGSTKELVRLLPVNSITHYQFVHFVDIDRDYTSILSDVEREWQRIDTHYEIPYYPHISVGWDNNPRFNSFRPGIANSTLQQFEKGLLMAKTYIDTHDREVPLITINSWNEWTESSYLEPDDLNGYGYLEAVKKVFTD